MSAPSRAERAGEAGPQVAVDPEKLEVAPGFAHASVQGWTPELATEKDVREALETASDYRGEVTRAAKDGAVLEGYIFDRVSGATLENSFLRIMPSSGGERRKIAYAD